MTPPAMSGDVLDQADSIVLDEYVRIHGCPQLADQTIDPCAACGHGRAVHSHHRRGLDCSFCQCDLFTPPGAARSGLAWFVTLAAACLTAWGADRHRGRVPPASP
jgi:hypothetical protein